MVRLLTNKEIFLYLISQSFTDSKEYQIAKKNKIKILSLSLQLNSRSVCRFSLVEWRKVRATQSTIFPNGKLFVRAE